MKMEAIKRLAAAAVFAILLATVSFREASSQPNLVQELAPGVFFRAAEPDKGIIANGGWVVFRDYVLVIDANYPWGARPFLGDIRRTTSKPIRFAFDTHYHGDHAFGNSLFVDAGATIVASAEAAAESRAKNPAAFAKMTVPAGQSAEGARLEHPQIAFSDKLVFDDGEHRVELLRLGPGHTRGDAVAWLPKEKILFTGDLCVNRPGNFVGDVDADPDNWLRALDVMAQWPVIRLAPGHGALGSSDAIRGQRAYLAAMIDAVRAGLAKGGTPEQATRDADLTRIKPWGADTGRNEVSMKLIWAKLAARK